MQNLITNLELIKIFSEQKQLTEEDIQDSMFVISAELQKAFERIELLEQQVRILLYA